MESCAFASKSLATHMLVIVLFSCLISIGLSAQGPAAPEANLPDAPSGPPGASTPVSRPEALTMSDRVAEYRQSTFTPFALVFPAFEAGYHQLVNDPGEWNQGAEGYGKRLASSYGSLAIGNTITFGVAALDGEDPAYQPSNYPKKAILRRLGYAIEYTFVSHKSGGGSMFAFSHIIGDYGSGFVANQWYPDRQKSVHNALYLGTWSLVGDAGSNLLKEFVRPHFIFGPKKNKKAQP